MMTPPDSCGRIWNGDEEDDDFERSGMLCVDPLGPVV